MSVFTCWDVADGEPTEERGRKVEGFDLYDAAESFAERLYERGDPFTSLTVQVRDAAGVDHQVIVMPEHSVSFVSRDAKAP